MPRRKRAKKYWIPRTMRKNRVRNYIKREFGDKAFAKKGTIKREYLRKALDRAKDDSLKKSIRLAMVL
ncbi:MAG TPA: hypothetical protein VIL29_08790, partial [Pseudothermotoga sp.]